ncbi:MAG: N-acetyl-gamma-glutamyl-phosphate reductase [Synergistetes bacterium]|nr:N-acetyl-gamma-glutamyl-phosphate reductase [Synergistota bacterium]
MKRVVVFGGRGYTGGELLRLIALHDGFELEAVASRSAVGEPIWRYHPHLRSLLRMNFVSYEDALSEDFDVAFIALSHGEGIDLVKDIHERGKLVVDLSANFRLRSPSLYEEWYSFSHPYPELLSEAVYGLPEVHRGELREARIISGVGCNATAIILALLPIAERGLIERFHADIRVGSSAAGAKVYEGSHHPERSRALRIYAVYEHRHLAEVFQEFGVRGEIRITAVELVRGLQAVVRCELRERMSEREVFKIYRKKYNNERFVELCPLHPDHLRFPDPRWVSGSNMCMVGLKLHEGGRILTVVSVIDNLVKGASGSAIQSANIALGFPEDMGLRIAPVYPV